MKLNVFSNDELYDLHCATLEILQSTGIAIASEEYLKIFKDAGAVVDEKKLRVRLPPYLVEECLKKAPKNFILGARNSKHDLHVRRGKMFARPMSGALFIDDIESGEHRTPTLRDSESAFRLIDALENIAYASTLLMPSDVPTELTDVYTLACALSNTEKHVYVQTLSYKNFRHCLDLAFKVTDPEEFRKRPLISFPVATTSPLCLNPKDVLLQLIDAAKYKVPVLLDSSPMLGSTSPITLAGTIVLMNAEDLAINTFLQLVDPGSPVVYNPSAAAIDMRAAIPLMGSAETALMDAGAVELGHYYGLPTDMHGICTNTNAQDEQTGFEKAICSFLPALIGSELISGAGQLGAYNTMSFEQLVLDDEFVGIMQRFRKGITINDATLALDVIDKVGPGGYYLGQRHTRDYYPLDHHRTRVFDTTPYEKWEQAGKKNITAVAADAAKKMIREHEPEKLEPSVLESIQTILKQAATK